MTDLRADPIDYSLTWEHADQHLDAIQNALVSCREQLQQLRSGPFSEAQEFFEKTDGAYWSIQEASSVLTRLKDGSASNG